MSHCRAHIQRKQGVRLAKQLTCPLCNISFARRPRASEAFFLLFCQNQFAVARDTQQVLRALVFDE